MSRFKCVSCGGEYDDVSPDGVPYFHVCPGVSLVTARFEDGAIVEQPLRAYAGLTIAESQKAKDELVAAGGKADTIVIDLGRRDAPRANARDERTLRRATIAGVETRVIVSEGAGRAPIAPVAAPVPVDDAL